MGVGVLREVSFLPLCYWAAVVSRSNIAWTMDIKTIRSRLTGLDSLYIIYNMHDICQRTIAKLYPIQRPFHPEGQFGMLIDWLWTAITCKTSNLPSPIQLNSNQYRYICTRQLINYRVGISSMYKNEQGKCNPGGGHHGKNWVFNLILKLCNDSSGRADALGVHSGSRRSRICADLSS